MIIFTFIGLFFIVCVVIGVIIGCVFGMIDMAQIFAKTNQKDNHDESTQAMLKIISGGQTGVDRGALNAALGAGVACGGWCPENRQAEDGEIAAHYPVTPLVGAGYRKRTKQNVIDSHATVIIYHTEIVLGSGTELTLKTCIAQRKPYLLIDAAIVQPEIAGKHIAEFIQRHQIQIINFGGSRHSVVPMIEKYTEQAVLIAIESLHLPLKAY